MAEQKPDAVMVGGTHTALPGHVVGVHELKLNDTLGEQNTALGQVRSQFLRGNRWRSRVHCSL